MEKNIILKCFGLDNQVLKTSNHCNVIIAEEIGWQLIDSGHYSLIQVIKPDGTIFCEIEQ